MLQTLHITLTETLHTIHRGRDVVHYPDRDRDVVHNVSTIFFKKNPFFCINFNFFYIFAAV